MFPSCYLTSYLSALGRTCIFVTSAALGTCLKVAVGSKKIGKRQWKRSETQVCVSVATDIDDNHVNHLSAVAETLLF